MATGQRLSTTGSLPGAAADRGGNEWPEQSEYARRLSSIQGENRNVPKAFPRSDSGADTPAARAKRLFPLLLLALMLAIGSLLEPLRSGESLWLPKMLLAFLLAWALLRPAGR